MNLEYSLIFKVNMLREFGRNSGPPCSRFAQSSRRATQPLRGRHCKRREDRLPRRESGDSGLRRRPPLSARTATLGAFGPCGRLLRADRRAADGRMGAGRELRGRGIGRGMRGMGRGMREWGAALALPSSPVPASVRYVGAARRRARRQPPRPASPLRRGLILSFVSLVVIWSLCQSNDTNVHYHPIACKNPPPPLNAKSPVNLRG